VDVAKSARAKDNFLHPCELICTGISLHFVSFILVFVFQGNLFQVGGQSA
jgi:hypothetical protein